MILFVNDHSVEETVHPQPMYEVTPSSALSVDGRRFAQDIKLRDITGIARFIATHPDILKEPDPDRRYLQEATSALRIGSPESRYLAESYVEKCLIIRECRGKSNRQITEYLQPLADRNKDAWEYFYDDFDLVMDSLKKKVKASASEGRPRADPGDGGEKARLTDRHAEIADITRRVSQIRTGTVADNAKTVYTNYQNPGYASTAQGPTSRHAPDPSPPAAYVAAPLGDRQERLPPPPAQRRPPLAQEPKVTRTSNTVSRHAATEVSQEEVRSHGSQSSMVPSLRGNAVPDAVAKESKMDSRFKRKSPPEAGGFFKIGRVFAMLWHDEHGLDLPDDVSDHKWITTTKMGVEVFSHIRHFAVVREGHGFCWAVPINTYRGKGVKKRGFNQADIDAHAIIYTHGRPRTVNNEPSMSKEPILVVPANQDCELEVSSRINFDKIHTVE